MAEKYLAEFVVEAQLLKGRDMIKKARRALNKHFVGKEEIGKMKVSKEHEDSHWNISRSHHIMIKVGLTKNGNLEFIEKV